ncbi:TatD family hydrolase [Limosilactobacillus caecicola]|uniref:TatD family hydrolase n=1 Tax=Limosilactobacillus caecicola TaxID=2941332 RepID=UPI00203C30C8|nr:TatD family hydrolase [Limosilactobacillus caecicola]
MYIDVHCHNDATNAILQVQQAHHMASTISSTSNAEYRNNKKQVGSRQILSYGIHPWRAATEILDEELLRHVAVVGEIGLDNTWTTVPLTVQRPAFQCQLQSAADHHQPVVLHVKGVEEELLRTIRKFPRVHKLVHWYSANELLAQYLRVPNTWFSVGPDVFKDPAVQAVARQVSLDQLFIESDGFEGISWALDRPVDQGSYYQTIQQMYQFVAKLRDLTPGQLERQIELNWHNFMN